MALAAPHVFAFHLAMGVRLVGLAQSQFGARGGGGGGPSGAARSEGGGSGGGANNDEGNGAALLAIPLLACATTSWRRGGKWCLGTIGCPTLTGAMSSCRWFRVPHHCWQSLACWRNDELAAGQVTMPRHCRPFSCLLMRRRRRGADGGGSLLHRQWWGSDESALALLCNGSGGEADDFASG